MNLNHYGLINRLEVNKDQINQQGSIGRVIKVSDNKKDIVTSSGEIINSDSKQLILGDFVRVLNQEVETLAANTVLTEDNNTVVTNFDTALIICDAKHLDVDGIEHELNRIWESGALPVVVLINKGSSEKAKDAWYSVKTVAAFTDLYEVNDSSENDQLKRLFKPNQTLLLIGSNNADKTYLLKRLFDEEYSLSTNTIHLLKNDSLVINVDHGQEVNEQLGYHDVEAILNGCRFNDCTHTNEPGCKVLEAIKSGTLTEDRYEEYLKLQESVLDDEIEAIENYKVYDRRKDKEKEKNKFTKKHAKDDKLNAMSLT